MDDAQLFEVAEPREQLDGKPTDEPVVEALVVVHFDELVKVDAVKVKHEAQVITPNKVVRQLDHALQIVRVVLLQ